MTAPTIDYTRRALTWLMISTIIYLLLNGAQVFETLAVVPVWAADPPASLGLLRGPHGLDLQAFWIGFHTLHELTFVLAIVFCWKIPAVRRWLLALFAVHLALRVWTVAYFAPALIAFQTAALPAGSNVAELATAASWWQGLNLLRVGLFLLVSLALVPLIRQLSRATDRIQPPAQPACATGSTTR